MCFALSCSLDATVITNRSVTVDVCNADEDFSLLQCNTSVLASNCSTDDLAWVRCTLGSELKNKSLLIIC